MKVSCTACGASILADTAARNGGLCAPCKNGTRPSLERARIQREKDKTDPYHVLFGRLRDQAGTRGFTTLGPSEATYYAVAALFSDLNRGGVQLFFEANSPEFRKLATDGLAALDRNDLVIPLDEAQKLCAEQESRWASTQTAEKEMTHEDQLAGITDDLLEASDDVFARLEKFAVERGLVSDHR